MKTIIYADGGNRYFGEQENENLGYWKEYGSIRLFKYMYKGYRYFDNGMTSVIVFDNVKWSKEEKAKRKANGFLGIRQYLCE